MTGFCKWLAARGHAGQVCIEIQDDVLREGALDERGVKVFRSGLDRLRKHAQVVVMQGYSWCDSSTLYG